MANEIITSLAKVGKAVTSLTETAKDLVPQRKKRSVLLEQELILLKHVCRARGIEALTSASLDMLAATNRRIQQYNHTGPALQMDMRILTLQYEMLEHNLRSYESNF